MQTASFYGILKTLFYILAFYYIFKFLAKLFLPMLVKKVVEKAGEKFQKQHQQYSQDASSKRTQGNEEIVYNNTTAKNPRETKKVGEYVDYEEID